MNEIVRFLKESIGKEFRYADLNGGIEEIIKDIHIENEMLVINNINIDLKRYKNNKILDKNLISFYSKSLGTALILIE